jgi:hypothetical protein
MSNPSVLILESIIWKKAFHRTLALGKYYSTISDTEKENCKAREVPAVASTLATVPVLVPVPYVIKIPKGNTSLSLTKFLSDVVEEVEIEVETLWVEVQRTLLEI